MSQQPGQSQNIGAYFKSLSNGSEMGTRIRELDWSATPIGQVESWSPALRMMVRFLLANRFPLLLWWGPHYVSIYNDAYRPVLGTKHPWALGRPVSECWQEIWHVLQPLIDTPYHGGAATWNDDLLLEINRHGFFEETHFTIAYSPVPDETVPGGIGGVLATVHEITDKVIGERRILALRDLGACVGEAKSAEEACAAAAETLVRHDKDVPFVLIYLLEEDGNRARLAGITGIPPGRDISPLTVELESGNESGWPLAQAKESGKMQIVHQLSARFETVPPGPWSDPPNTGAVVPVFSRKGHEVSALLIAGVSSRLHWDESYRGFLELVSTQVASAIANARAYEEEKKRAEALAELDRAKTIFFSNVSHEFRTPLTLILAPLQEAIAEIQEGRQRERLELLHRNALRLQKLVNSLLDFSRIEAGRIKACFEPTDLTTLTSELASVFRSAIEKAEMRLIVNCQAISEPIYVDRDMYEKIVLNLLSNAFKFTLEGEIEVRLEELEEAVELSIRDTGAGMTEEQLSHLFERFHRIEGVIARTHEGTGIGLALVQELVKLHGGRVRVRSVPGQGSVFAVTIPKGKGHIPADQIGVTRSLASTGLSADHYVQEALKWLGEESTAPPASDTSLLSPEQPLLESSGPRPRIVWADDNTDMRDYVSKLLRPRFDVQSFSEGQAALAAVQRDTPDLVLADIMMPRLDGFGLLKALRADEHTRSVPVILISARAGEEAQIEGLQAGADDYLVKPFTARELVGLVEAHLKLVQFRKESAEVLRHRSQQFETLLNAAPLGIYLVNADFRIVHVNPVALAAFGNIPGGVAGRDFDEVIHLAWDKEFADEVVRIFRHALLTGKSYFTLERAACRIDRNITEYYEWRIDRITLPDGRYGLVCYFRDISQQVQARKLIERNRDALEESEKRAAAELEAMIRLREVGNFCARPAVDFNECLSCILGAAIDFTCADKGNIQLLDQHSGRLKVVAHHGFDSAFLEFFTDVDQNDAAACGAAMQLGDRIIVEDVTRSDLFREQPSLEVLLGAGVRAVQSTPLISSDREVLGIISTHFSRRHRPANRDLRLVDLLARQAADFLERRQIEEALREGDRRKDEFLAILAHELRNPLAPLRTALHILRMPNVDRDSFEEMYDIMERQLNLLMRLVDDLMEVSRITRGKIELRKEQTEVAAVIQRAIETSKPLIDNAHHKLTIDLPDERLTIHGDPVRLAQAVSNLLNNAAKYTEEGGHIWLTVRRNDSHVVLSVRDDGIGIPPEMLPRIFDPFIQLGRSYNRAQGGLGIGLTLVRSLVEMHGGTVEAKSAGPGLGSEFLVRLPLAQEPARPPDQNRPEDFSVPVAARRILVVDDNRDSAHMLSAFLRSLGADVWTVYDGLAALETVRSITPSVMFLDIGMPELDGYELARRVRMQQENRDMTLIAISGWGQQEDHLRSKEVGIDHHLVKPVDPEIVRRLLASLPC
jgi:signal transduction histidine kinase/DNA-binding response OmpR family regulator